MRDARAAKVSQLTVALAGQSFGVDVNPAANRLRIISDTGQNLRHNLDDPNGAPAAGTTATDGMLTVPPATVAAAGVTGAAYTNNDLDPDTATTLFDVDTMLNQVAAQSPANAGSLAATGRFAGRPGRRRRVRHLHHAARRAASGGFRSPPPRRPGPTVVETAVSRPARDPAAARPRGP